MLVVIDNGGGGIFSFLPQSSELDEAYFERLFGTPQRIDVADLARAAGCDTIEVASREELPTQLDAALSARRGGARLSSSCAATARRTWRSTPSSKAEVALALA